MYTIYIYLFVLQLHAGGISLAPLFEMCVRKSLPSDPNEYWDSRLSRERTDRGDGLRVRTGPKSESVGLHTVRIFQREL